MNTDIFQDIFSYAADIDILEFCGLLFGLLCVFFLIRENILTWICGILYVLISFFIFAQARLYGDFLLHIFYLVLNIYGWYYWVAGKKPGDTELHITTLRKKEIWIVAMLSAAGIMLFTSGLSNAHRLIDALPPASLPFWDSVTSVLSITGMWLTAKKKLDNWYYWLVVDILATGIYIYKDLYFYSALYFIYIGMAVAGYLTWRKKMKQYSSL